MGVLYSEGTLRSLGVYLTYNRLIDFLAYYPRGKFAREVRGKNSPLWADRVRFELGEPPVKIYPPGGYRYYNIATTNRKPWGVLGLYGRHNGQIILSKWKCQDLVSNGPTHFLITELGLFCYFAKTTDPLNVKEGTLEYMSKVKGRVIAIKMGQYGYVWALNNQGELFGCQSNIGRTFKKIEGIPPVRYMNLREGGRQDDALLYIITFSGEHRILRRDQLQPYRVVPEVRNNSITRFWPNQDISPPNPPMLAWDYFSSTPKGKMVLVPGESATVLSRPGMRPNEVYLLPNEPFIEFFDVTEGKLVIRDDVNCVFLANGRVLFYDRVGTYDRRYQEELSKKRREHPEQYRTNDTVIIKKTPGEAGRARVTALGEYLPGSKENPYRGMHLAVIWK